MDVDMPQTSTKIDGPLVKQFSIFLPNKVGAMMELVKLLHAQNAHVLAMSISESTDSAIARIGETHLAFIQRMYSNSTVDVENEGHTFGQGLSLQDKKALIAFLSTL